MVKSKVIEPKVVPAAYARARCLLAALLSADEPSLKDLVIACDLEQESLWVRRESGSHSVPDHAQGAYEAASIIHEAALEALRLKAAP